MYIHEYGSPDLPTVILLHPMEVTGEDLYNIMSPHLKGQYHIISPDQGDTVIQRPFIHASKKHSPLNNG